MFCQMLGAYVDKKLPKADFERYFKDTAIAKLEKTGEEDMRNALLRFKRKCAWLRLVRLKSLANCI
jgi:hypothetical protein